MLDKDQFSPSSFISTINKQGVMIPNKYVMEIPAPPVLAGGDQNDLRQIAVRVSSLELPGKQLATSEVKYYGPFRKSPYATLYEDLNFTVMLSDDARERNYFTKWVDHIIGYNDALVEYSNMYTIDAKFHSFDPTGQSVFTCSFLDAFPIQIGQIAYSYEAEAPATCQITFAYTKWSQEYHTRSGANMGQVGNPQQPNPQSSTVTQPVDLTAPFSPRPSLDQLLAMQSISPESMIMSNIPSNIQQRKAEFESVTSSFADVNRTVRSSFANLTSGVRSFFS